MRSVLDSMVKKKNKKQEFLPLCAEGTQNGIFCYIKLLYKHLGENL